MTVVTSTRTLTVAVGAGTMAGAVVGITGIRITTAAGVMAAAGTTGIPITTVAGDTAAAGITGTSGDHPEERGFGPFLFRKRRFAGDANARWALNSSAFPTATPCARRHAATTQRS